MGDAEPTVWSAHSGDSGAPLVVLVHGSMDRSAGLLRVSRFLDRHVLVARYDRRGYGRSQSLAPGRMSTQVDDLVSVLGGRRAVLIGHSFGGNVCLAAAVARPDLVAAVGVHETPLSWEPWWPGNTAGGVAVGLSDDPQRAVEQFMTSMIGAERWAALPLRTRRARLAEGPAMLAELGDLRHHRPWRAADITVPVVACRGSAARAHHVLGTNHLAATVTGAQLEILEGAGHGAPITHPAEFVHHFVRCVLERAGPPWAGRIAPQGEA